jgi:hypothetical protein
MKSESRTMIIVLMVLLGVATACAKQTVPNGPTTPYVFDNGKRALLPEQPANMTRGSWSPTQPDAKRASDGVPNFLKSASPKIAAKFDGYYGQLYGVTDNGDKKIRLMFFCHLDSIMVDHWTQNAFLVNDGGDCYFEVDFDPSADAYSNFRANGEA